MKKSKYRILHVFGNLNLNGAESRIMDIYRYLDKNEIQFDFLVLFQDDSYFSEEIRELGGRIFNVTHPRESLVRHIIDVFKVMKHNGPFQAVHSHTSYHSGLVSLIAKIAGINNRIVHARTTSSKNIKKLGTKIQLIVGRFLILNYSTKLVSISHESALFLYGEKKTHNNSVKLIPNSINLESFNKVDAKDILKIKKELNITQDKLVIGHVGRFENMKNHKFIIKLARKLKEEEKNFVIILIGEGELMMSIQQLVYKYKLENNVLLLGQREDIPIMMNVFDVFIMPSYFEGLGGAVIEAQAAGTPSVVSEGLPQEVDMGLGLVEFHSLEESLSEWLEALYNTVDQKKVDFEEILTAFHEKGYTLKNTEAHFKDIYNIAP